MQSKNTINVNEDNKQKYDAIVSYLQILYHSNSKLFIRRPGEGIKTIDLKNILPEERKYKFVNYLLNAEQEGAELYVKKPNHELHRLLLLETLHHGQIPKVVTNKKKRD